MCMATAVEGPVMCKATAVELELRTEAAVKEPATLLCIGVGAL
jgi:hypothetical protein